MIDSLQVILRRMFKKAYAESLHPMATPDGRALTVLFDRPGENFPPVNLEGPCLNVTLVDVRENRKLRKNDRVTTGVGQRQLVSQAPFQLDCHYLASAWIKGTQEPREQTRLERRLLYEAAAAVLRHNPIDVRVVMDLPDSFPSPENATDQDWREYKQQLDDLSEPNEPPIVSAQEFECLQEDSVLLTRQLPVDTLPPEGFSKLSEFWGLMEQNAQWRPTVYFIVTIPVERIRQPRGPEVRSIAARIINKSGRRSVPEEPGRLLDDRELIFAIGGKVTVNGHPLAGLTVTLTGQRTDESSLVHESRTDDEGRYRFVISLESTGSDDPDWKWKIIAGSKELKLDGPLASHSLHTFDIELP